VSLVVALTPTRAGGMLVASTWDEWVLPRMTERVLNTGSIRRLRRTVTDTLHGEVAEIGFGSGLNVPWYPATVTRVLAVEPSMTARRLAAARIEASRVPVDFLGLDGQDLPLPDASVDAVLCTFTLCTIADPQRALAEVIRVLRPGGTFHFAEHGLAPTQPLASWQNRLNPVERVVAGGCNLNRRIDELISRSGLQFEWLQTALLPGPRLTRPWGYVYSGIARTAD
ncbi:MAG: class I SAM-dependent methyltransferase, partial [Actinomycetes bacterium]